MACLFYEWILIENQALIISVVNSEKKQAKIIFRSWKGRYQF